MVTVASGMPFMSVVRYSSWVAVTRCGISPRKRQLDVARAQHGPGLGVLKAGRRLVERVVGGQQRAHLALQFLVRRAADPLRAARACQIAELNH